jgi:hypothetical protein
MQLIFIWYKNCCFKCNIFYPWLMISAQKQYSLLIVFLTFYFNKWFSHIFKFRLNIFFLDFFVRSCHSVELFVLIFRLSTVRCLFWFPVLVQYLFWFSVLVQCFFSFIFIDLLQSKFSANSITLVSITWTDNLYEHLLRIFITNSKFINDLLYRDLIKEVFFCLMIREIQHNKNNERG